MTRAGPRRRSTSPSSSGPARDDGKHEVATVLQRIDLADRISSSSRPRRSTVDGFPDDTLVRGALDSCWRAPRDVEPRWRATIVQADPGRGRARRRQLRRGDRAPARERRRSAARCRPTRLHRARRDARRGRPVLPRRRARSSDAATGASSTPVELPQDYAVVLALPHGADEGVDGAPSTAASTTGGGADGWMTATKRCEPRSQPSAAPATSPPCRRTTSPPRRSRPSSRRARRVPRRRHAAPARPSTGSSIDAAPRRARARQALAARGTHLADAFRPGTGEPVRSTA